MEQKGSNNCPQNRAKDREMKDRTEMIKTFQEVNIRIAKHQRQDREKCKERNESRNYQNCTGLKHTFPDRQDPLGSQHSG